MSHQMITEMVTELNFINGAPLVSKQKKLDVDSCRLALFVAHSDVLAIAAFARLAGRGGLCLVGWNGWMGGWPCVLCSVEWGQAASLPPFLRPLDFLSSVSEHVKRAKRTPAACEKTDGHCTASLVLAASHLNKN